jgi:hypothetical protein
MKITDASRLGNAELTAELTRLARCEREATAALIVHLGEFDVRRLFEGPGYSSLFRYGMAVLHLSEDAVYNRIKTARAARRFPVIIERLESGAPSPTTVRLLAPRLTHENHQELLAAASGKGKQAVEELLAQRFPRPDMPARVRKVPSRPAAPMADVAATGATPTACPPVAGCEPLAAATPPVVPRVEAAHNGYEADLFYGPGKRRTRGDVVPDGRANFGRVTVPGTGPGTSTHSDSRSRPLGRPTPRETGGHSPANP